MGTLEAGSSMGPVFDRSNVTICNRILHIPIYGNFPDEVSDRGLECAPIDSDSMKNHVIHGNITDPRGILHILYRLKTL